MTAYELLLIGGGVGKTTVAWDVSSTLQETPGRKRHMIVDFKGLPLFVMVAPADMHDSVEPAKRSSGCG